MSALYPTDGKLNLPPDKYSDGLRRRVAEEASKVSFSETSNTIATTTGGAVGKRQCEEFSSLKKKQAQNFCTYLENHRHRIINYGYYQAEKICPKGYRFAYAIASGAVESTVKQIDRRLKISGAQWNQENVPQVLKHRCAYLNDTLFTH